MNWLLSLTEELKNFDQDSYTEPEEELNEFGETVVGTMDDYLKSLYSLARLTHKQAEIKDLQVKLAHLRSNNQEPSEQIKKSHAVAHHMAEKASVLMEIFWISIRHQFGILGPYDIGLRKGWKIVQFQHNGLNNLGMTIPGLGITEL